MRADRPWLAVALAGAIAVAVVAGGCATSGSSVQAGNPAAQAAASPPAAPAQDTELAHAMDGEAEAAVAATHYLEFRARPGPLIGHTYMVYGPLDESGQPAETNHVGLLPKGGAAGLAAGAAPLPIPATLEPGWADLNYPVMVTYREDLDAQRYQRLLAFVAEARTRNLIWNLWVYNCNDFAAELAQAVGLKAPALRVVASQIYVAGLRAMNQAESGSGSAAGPPAHLYERGGHDI